MLDVYVCNYSNSSVSKNVYGFRRIINVTVGLTYVCEFYGSGGGGSQATFALTQNGISQVSAYGSLLKVIGYR